MSSHKPHDIFEDRNQFQLERIILFTDAVFAIAITLLIIEIKVPETIHHAEHGREVWDALLGISLKLAGFVFSFILIGVYWMAHHRMFKYVTGYNNRLLWLNMWLLMAIVFLPFTTALAFENIPSDIDVPFIIYSFNHIVVSFSYFRLWRYISNPKHKLSVGLTDKKFMRYNYWRSFTIIFIFSITILLCIFLPGAGRLFTILCMFAVPALNRIFGMKN